ncbi:MAG: hypothetical protein KAW14_03005, partial [Candidatus Aegiribacteria sp.]|nr:hypothetical protein [Candidatus Aegiribacteria sp.]
FQYHIHSNSVAKLETISECFLGAVYFNWDSINVILFNADAIGFTRESMRVDWRVVKRWQARISLNSD